MFFHPSDIEREMKVSAFEPGLPKLTLGKTYKMTVEHVPTGDGKFYHNIARGSRDGPYLIQEALPIEPTPIPKEPTQPAQQPAFQGNVAESFERIKHREIRREWAIGASIELARKNDPMGQKHTEVKDLIATARELEQFVMEEKK